MEILNQEGNVQPRTGTPMSEVCENFALDIVEEEAFKNWLDTRGATPDSFAGKSDSEAFSLLSFLCAEWSESGARELAHAASDLAPESDQGS